MIVYIAKAIDFAGYTESGPAWFADWKYRTVGTYTDRGLAEAAATGQAVVNVADLGKRGIGARPSEDKPWIEIEELDLKEHLDQLLGGIEGLIYDFQISNDDEQFFRGSSD